MCTNTVLGGYFTLATAQINFQEIPDEYKIRLPKYPVPAIRIARLAVSKDIKGKGLGKDLLRQSFIKIVQVSDITGVYFILVDAKETSKSFYEHYGFIKLNDNELLKGIDESQAEISKATAILKDILKDVKDDIELQKI